MGFGFNLFFIFILVPITGILLAVWLVSRKLIFGKIIGVIWLGVILIVFFASILNWILPSLELDKEDYYGSYIINMECFKGEQANWQYNHFRFEITEEDSIFFYETEKKEILRTYKGTIGTSNPEIYKSVRLKLNMEKPTCHILSSNPTTYRNNRKFNLVFYSPKFHNVFFKKGRWKQIE